MVISSVASEPSLAESGEAPSFRPWLTITLTLVVCVAYMAAQTVALIAILALQAATNESFDVELWLEQAPSNGFVLAVCTLSGMIAVVPLVVALAGQLSPLSARDYLGLRWPSAKSAIRWIAALLVFMLVTDGVTWLLGMDVVPGFMHQAYSTAGPPPFLWLALIVGAPISEELIFRGIVFRGLVETRLKLVGTALLTSLAWALVHVQYDLYGISTIFLIGLLLAAARHASQSVVLCICMHGLINLVATIQVAFVVNAS